MTIATRNGLARLALAVLCTASLNAGAATILINDFYNTGVDANGHEINTNNAADIHYTVDGVAAVIKPGIWGHDDAESNWITRYANTYSFGTKTFYTNFTIGADADLSTVLLNFTFGHDGTGVVFLNGTQLAYYAGWSGVQAVSLDASTNNTFLSHLQLGTNTLGFRISADGIPNGMRITDAFGSYEGPDAAPVPAPMSLGLLGLGLVGLRSRGHRLAAA